MDYDIPDLLVSMVNNYKNARTENERLNIQIRLEKCRDFISKGLKENENKSPESYFRKKK